MRKFEEIIKDITTKLKDNLTAENTEFMQELKANIDELQTAHETTKEENNKLKDKIVEQVKFTSFKEDLREDPVKEALTIDEAIAKALKEIK